VLPDNLLRELLTAEYPDVPTARMHNDASQRTAALKVAEILALVAL
jgi:hypothetical protein